MCVRFVIQAIDEDSRRKQGLLVAAGELCDGDALSREGERLVREHLDWFNEHLRVPKILQRHDSIRALSWFKAEAARPISRMWELVHVLRSHDIHVELLKTDDAGNVVYQDPWQVVATPRKSVKRPW